MIRGVVFDLGETLIRFEGDWPQVFEESRQELIRYLCERGYDLPQEEFSESLRRRIEDAQVQRERDYIERPSADLLAETLTEFGINHLPQDQMNEALAKMFAASENAWQAMPGLGTVLESVRQRDVRLGMISNASDVANVYRLVDGAGVRPFFDPILVSAGVGVRKPALAIFERLLDGWQLPAEQTVMIGDTLGADILGAQRAGMRQIWLRTAADRTDNRALAGTVIPERTAEDLTEIPGLLAELDRDGGSPVGWF